MVKKSLSAGIFYLSIAFLLLAGSAEAQDIAGPRGSASLHKWQPVQLTFTGPERAENAATFSDYRFNLVVTTPSGQQLTVPGFFAADGDAANSGASSGNQWRAYVLPREEGTYQYEARFRCGDDVALSTNPNAGQACSGAASFDGMSGTFAVGAAQNGAPGHYARGLLQQDGSQMRFDDGSLFVKGGADSPENLLAYSEFDNTYNADGTDYVRAYEPHVQDWEGGDPTWSGGDGSATKGKGLIGALNYLSSEGVNAFSFLTMNVNGDGYDVWPWTEPDARFTFDASKLAQWEVVFSHGDRRGLFLHFKIQERENDGLLGGLLGGTPTEERKLYYRELVARFSHHHALNWNLGEENSNSASERKAFAEYFKALDPYDHPVVVHTYPNEYDDIYGDLLGFKPFDGPSIQLADMNDGAAWDLANEWKRRSDDAGDPWVCSIDEPGSAGDGVYQGNGEPNGGNLPEARAVMYATYLAGCYGTEWYFGYSKPNNDLNLNDFRSRSTWWDQVGVAMEAMNEFYDNAALNSLTSQEIESGYVMESEAGTPTAIAYVEDGTSSFGSSYEEAVYINARTGERSASQSVNGGLEAPFSGDAVALLTGTGGQDDGGQDDGGQDDGGQDDGGQDDGGQDDGGGIDADAGSSGAFQEENGLAVIEMESGDAPDSWEQQSTLDDHTGEGYLHYDGSDALNNPGQDVIEYQVAIQNPGTYRFQWRSRAGGNSTTEENDSWLKILADSFYGKKSGSVVCPKGYDAGQNDCSGSDPEGAGSGGWFKVYVNSTSWNWKTATSDNDPHGIFAEFDQAGTYTIQLAARSVGHTIDRMVLHRVGSGGPVPNDPLATSIPESSQGDGSQDDGSQDDGSQDDGSQDDGSQDDGSQDDGSQDDGSQDDGSQDDGGGEPITIPARINAGGAAFTDAEGNTWQADTDGSYYTGGRTYNNDEVAIEAADDALYQTERYGANGATFDYQFPLSGSGGPYTVRLHFAEIYWGVDNNEEGADARVFDVIIEGQTVLSDYDIFADVGTATAVTKTYTDRSDRNGNGTLDIRFESSANNAKVSGIEVLGDSGTNADAGDDGDSGDGSGDSDAPFEVTSFTLVNADTDEDVRTLSDGDAIALKALPTENLNVRADVEGGGVSSVVFALDGKKNVRTESVAPYALEGDDEGDYDAYGTWTPSVGEHTLTATPYAKDDGKGEQGAAHTITFSVSKSLSAEVRSFEATSKGGQVVVNWSTEAKARSDRFRLQRRPADGVGEWVNVSIVEAKTEEGAEEKAKRYSFHVKDVKAGRHDFRLQPMDSESGESSDEGVETTVSVTEEFVLQPPAPNPLRDKATVRFAVRAPQEVRLELFNTLGQLVRTLYEGAVPANTRRSLTLRADDLASGLYVVRLTGESEQQTQTIVVVR